MVLKTLSLGSGANGGLIEAFGFRLKLNLGSGVR